MGTTNMKAMMDELVGSAPKFFAQNMVGASEQDIARLEVAAGTVLSDGHRTLLRYLGGTSAEECELSVFIAGRDLSIPTILQCYEEYGAPPAGYCYLSNVPEERVVLKHGKTPEDDPLLGALTWETEEFYFFDPAQEEHLEDWILKWVTNFRIAQPEFCVSWNGRMDTPDWSEPYKETMAVLTQMGFQAVASHPTSTFITRDLACAKIFSDGSATMAGDDLDEIKHIMAVLKDHTYIQGLHLKPATNRVRAPRE